jgi:adenylate kinase family enzyme
VTTDLPKKSDLDRVAVVGTSCSGKTTFARALAERIIAPRIELDALHWGPNWVEKPDDEFRALVEAAIAADRWVVDGNYHVVRDTVWSAATHVVWLDYSFPVVFSRALRRTIRRSVTGEELFAGNRETLRGAFLRRDSILLWVLDTYRKRRRVYGQLSRGSGYPNLRWVVFRRPAAAEAFLRSLDRAR